MFNNEELYSGITGAWIAAGYNSWYRRIIRERTGQRLCGI
jgi:hypothetical protein